MSNNGWLASKPCQKHESCHKHEHDHHPDKKDCCCNRDMLRALKLLFNHSIKYHVKDDEFVFIGKKYIIGSPLEKPHGSNHELYYGDNLIYPDAKLVSIDHCQSDFINIEACGVFYPVPVKVEDRKDYFIKYDVDRVSLCDLDVVSFSYTEYGSFDFKEKLTELLDDKYDCHCHKDDDCCCGDGIFKDLYKPYSFAYNKVNITAGWLFVEDAKILGKIGNILVFANTSGDTKRIYFACLESIGFFEPAK